jgi:predicted dehydrogenase
MADKVGIGIVGAGSIGIRGALNHLILPDAQEVAYVAAICDPVPGRAKAAAEKYGSPSYYERYEDLLADPGVHAVTLGSPIGLHYEQGVKAIEAGKHVHFNKTMCITVDEADHLIELAARSKVHLVASPGVMLHPPARRMRRAILEGRLGRLVWAAAGAAIGTYHLEEPVRQGDDLLSNIDPSWYFRRPDGGPLWDVTVYAMHYLTGIVGPAQRVSAMSGLVVPEREFRGRKIPCEMDDNTLMLLDFGGSFFALGYGTPAGGVTRGFEPSIFGTEGSIVGCMLGDESLRRPGDHAPHVTPEHEQLGESHVFEDIMQLVECARSSRPSVASAGHARHVIDIFESAYRSAATGQIQELRTSFEPLPLADPI